MPVRDRLLFLQPVARELKKQAMTIRGLSLLCSLAVHILVVGVVFQMGAGNSSARVNLDRPVYTVDLVTLDPGKGGGKAKTAIKKDTVRPAPAPAAKPKPAPKPEPKAKAVSEKKKKPTPQAAKKSAPKPEPKPKSKPKAEPQPRETRSREEILAGALGSARQQASSRSRQDEEILAQALAAAGSESGNSGGFQGEGQGTGGATALDVYASLAKEKIRENWRFPRLAGRNLSVALEIDIDSQGKIIGSRIVESSGRSDFDTSAMQAVAETGSFPRPPTGIRKLIIRFNLDEFFS